MNYYFLHTYEELEQLAPAWDKLFKVCEVPTFAASGGFARAWWRVYGKSRSPHFVVGEDESGDTCLIAPFQSEKNDPLFWEGIGGEDFNYDPILVKPGNVDSLKRMFTWLRHQSGWYRIRFRTAAAATLSHLFRFIYTDSLNLVQKLSRWANWGSLFVEQNSRANLPVLTRETLQKLTEVRKHKSYRRHIKKLQQKGVFDFFTVTHPDEVACYFDRFCELHIAEWASRGNVSRFADPETRRFYYLLLQELAASQMLRMGILTLDGRPIAFDLGVQSDGRLESWIPCFDLNYAKVSPGYLLFNYAIQCAAADGVTEMDLGRGTFGYKMQCTPDVRRTVLMEVYRSAFRAFSYKLRHRPTW